MRSTPGLIGVAARQHRPSNAGELIGEGNHQHIAMESPARGLNPGPQAEPGSVRSTYQHDVRGLPEQGP